MTISHWFNTKLFSLVHMNNLVYNTCWEDPRLDHVALELTPQDTVMVISSAGCNALDYAIAGPKHVHAVDMNPRQNALLELKIAGIRALAYEEFFALFGRGRMPGFKAVYQARLRQHLSPWSQRYWDRRTHFFDSRYSFYFRGSSGSVAHFCQHYIDKVAKIRGEMNALLDAKSVEEQRAIYDRSIRKAFWTGFMKRVFSSDATLSMLGVPRAQREQVERTYKGGIAAFIEDCVETVFARLPIHDNYFWRVYLTGEYTPECCPRYVTREGFEALKGGNVDRVSTHTCSIEQFLVQNPVSISRFILLDHMDWLAAYRADLLQSEWQAIVNRAAPRTRILFRSGGMHVDYVDPLRVTYGGKQVAMGDVLTYNQTLAESLHQKDRVHTYGSFYIADLKPA